MLRCAASFVTVEYHKYASFLRICPPCLWSIYEIVDDLSYRLRLSITSNFIHLTSNLA
jgi:hypothetical protein